jgi:hypothetical protein
MQARRCHGCAAPLPQAIEGEPYRCPFCGLLHDAVAPTPGVHVHAGGASARARVPRWLIAVFAVTLLVTLLPGLIGVLFVWLASSAVTSSTASLEPGAASTMRSTLRPGPAARTTANLSDLPLGFHDLEASPPPGSLGSLDAVQAVPWALAIAQAWQADARLDRIDVERLRPDGTINVLDDRDATLTYRFRSPGRTEALRQQGRVQADAEAITAFWVRVKSGAVQVYGDRNRATTIRHHVPAPHPEAMSVAELLARPAVRALVTELPFLRGYLIHLDREGWVWYFSSLANETRPRVRARDGAVWPYR